MLYLATALDKLAIVTSTATNLDVHASYMDVTATGLVNPGRSVTLISSASSIDIVGPTPVTGDIRTVKTIIARNRHTTLGQTVTLNHVSGGSGVDTVELFKAALAPGESLHYHEAAGFFVYDAQGRPKTNDGAGAINSLNLVVLGADVTNNNAVANTISDVTGLSFPVVSGETYWFQFVIAYTAAATTTGSRWSINGPASPTLLNYMSEYTLTATSNTVNSGSAYDSPATANATSLTSGNIARITGIIKPSANGTVIARFASEVANSAIVAKAGSLLQWVRTL